LALAGVLLLPVGASAQVPPPLQQQRMNTGRPDRRATLERQILQRFVDQSAAEMRLPRERRDRLERWLTESTAERRDLTTRAADLRKRLVDAVGDPATTDAEFERILRDLDALRQREYELWKRDQDELARTLTPRQRAHFAIRLLRLQEMIDEQRGGSPPGDLESLP
jgi:uncharacterized membrane protein